MKHALLALLVTVAPVASAQEEYRPALPAHPDAVAPSAAAPSDLDARLHHQPTQATVEQRERARLGSAAAKRRADQEQAEIDQLNRELLGKPAARPPQ